MAQKYSEMTAKKGVQCPKHPREYLIYEHHSGTMVCPKCGVVVVEQMIDEGAEWRTFAEDGAEKSRVGGAENPFLSSTANLSTSVINAGGKQNSFARSIITISNRRSVDRALTAAYKEIRDIATRINVPASVVDLAMNLYSRAYRKRELKGNILFRDPKTAACLYVACNEEGVPRTSSEICAACDFSRSDINRWAKKILTVLDMSKKPDQACDYIPRFAAMLNMPANVKKAAFGLAAKIGQRDIGPTTTSECLAATAIYLTVLRTEHRRTTQEIGSCLNLTEKSICECINIFQRMAK